mmetsp:Transcript_42336/g.88197  ORF Transcript_42336/g.88197 Transcript_42336/m.88197 type:complete len:225 (+) Transcript_42336:356-1030(+)
MTVTISHPQTRSSSTSLAFFVPFQSNPSFELGILKRPFVHLFHDVVESLVGCLELPSNLCHLVTSRVLSKGISRKYRWLQATDVFGFVDRNQPAPGLGGQSFYYVFRFVEILPFGSFVHQSAFGDNSAVCANPISLPPIRYQRRRVAAAALLFGVVFHTESIAFVVGIRIEQDGGGLRSVRTHVSAGCYGGGRRNRPGQNLLVRVRPAASGRRGAPWYHLWLVC